jgi:hypothetical protein
VFQPADDPNYIVVNLRFESVDAANNFRKFLTEVVWASPENSPALVGAPTACVLTESSSRVRRETVVIVRKFE